MKLEFTGFLRACSAFVIVCGTGHLWAQPPRGLLAASVGPKAVKVVLKHFTINSLAMDPNTHKPLRTDGSWSISKSRSASCPQAAEMCVEVFYTVPEQSAKCSWVISLNEGGTDGIVLDESEDTDNYMVRTISGTEALPFIKSRSKPVFPPIAIVARVSGDVTTRVLVSKSGDLQQVRVVSGPPMLQQASIDAAKNWKFTPMTIGTRTVQYEVELVFTYALITSDPRMSIVRTVP